MRVVNGRDSAVMLRELELIMQAMSADLVFTSETVDEAINWFKQHPWDWDLAAINLFLKPGNGVKLLNACRGQSAEQRAVILSGLHPLQSVPVEA